MLEFLSRVAQVPVLAWLGGALGFMILLTLVNKVPATYNIRNLTVRWWTTLMTALSFTLVIGLLTVMLAFVNGMDKLTREGGRPGNVIVLSEGATDEVFSNLGYSNPANLDRQPGVLQFDEKRPLSSREVFIFVNQPVPVKEGEKPRRRFLQLRGVEDPVVSGKVHGLELYEGSSWFSPSGVQPLPDGSGTAIQGVLGEGIAGELGRDVGKPSLEPGDVFEVADRKWVCVGITHSLGSTFGSELWAKRERIGPEFGKDNLTTLVLATKDAKEADRVAKDISVNYKEAALGAQPETEYYAKLSENNKQFLFAIYFIAIFMAVGGVFGVMNTMFAAINQRIKDIGVLRILGFARWQVLTSFLLESMLIALLGGILGCLVGLLVNGWTMTSIVSSGAGGGKSVVFRLVVDQDILAKGLLFALVMGGLGGFIPAISAMRLRALETLR